MQQSTDTGDELVDELVDEYISDYEVGQDNVQPLGLDFHNPVFAISAVSVIVFVVFTLFFPELAKHWFGDLRPWLTTRFDWFFMAAGNFFVLFCIALIVLPVGKVRIGGPDAEPMYSYVSWVSMLFAAGIGIGIMFYAVLEPMNHLLTPPLGLEGLSEDARRELAMAATVFHWAIHPWAVYGIVGLALAFFAFNKGLPLIVRSAMYPIFGERVWGWPGHVIDVLAVFATLFGLATSLGYGAEQSAGGLAYLFGISEGHVVKLTIIVVITIMALISVLRGLDGGIKVLSESNMAMAAVLGLFVLLVGPTLESLGAIVDNTLAYFRYMPALSNWVGREDMYYMHDWTTFYWSWWIAFSPFVGMFIARISSGRTVREFLLVSILAPSFIFIVWMTVFGNAAMDQYLLQGYEGVVDTVRNFQPELSLFLFLAEYPLATLTSGIGILLVLIFFVTSMDSGALVVDTMTAGGKIDAPIAQRVFWCVFLGLIGIALMEGGGLSSLQALALATGFPFGIVILLMSVSLYKGLAAEVKLLEAQAHVQAEAEADAETEQAEGEKA
ncbi:BCCT family transporter [Lentisalinibacter orientalis]|uniref:BCCT family transporter n=1 Tax=Lentisalinibacter orientalis TaxID=2992241 RepID=UPI00386C4023